MPRLVVVPSPTCASENKSRQPETWLPSPSQSSTPSKANISKHHLSGAVVSPARHPAAAGYRTGMQLQTTRHATMAPPQLLPQSTSLKRNPHHHNCTTQSQTGRKTRSLESIKHAHKSQTLLTPPKATIATPLLNPATDTGVPRLVVVPSPTCASENKSRQLDTAFPPQPIISPIKSNHLKPITCP